MTQTLDAVMRLDEMATTTLRAAKRGTTRHALLSLHVAIDSAKEHADMLANAHRGEMLAKAATLSSCRGFVQMMLWLLEGGPALAHAIFSPVLAGGTPKKLNVAWVDHVTAELYRVIVQEYGGRTKKPKTKVPRKRQPRKSAKGQLLQPEAVLEPARKADGRIERPITVPDATMIEEAEARRAVRRSTRLQKVADAKKELLREGSQDAWDRAAACDSDDSDNDLDEDYDGEKDGDDRDDDDDDRGESEPDTTSGVAPSSSAAGDAKAGSLRKPRAGAVATGRVELRVPRAKPDGKPSVTAPLETKKFSVRTKQITVGFSSFDSTPLKHYRALTIAFVETLFEILFAPGLRRANVHDDLRFDAEKTTNKNGTSTQRLMALVIAKGWMLDVFRSAAGTELVWMSSSLWEIWRRPHHNFAKEGWRGSVWRMVQPLRQAYRIALEENTIVEPPHEMQAFEQDAHLWFTNNPRITDKLVDFDAHFQYHLDELRSGSFQRNDPSGPELYRALAVGNKRVTGAVPGKRSATRSNTRVGALPTDVTRLPTASHWGLPAVMLSMEFEREDRARRHKEAGGTGEPPGVREKDRDAELVFTGRNPRNPGSSSRLSRDMLNPILDNWSTNRILEEYIPASRIREPAYFKNLVLAIATGQSVPTQKFLVQWMTVMPETIEQMTQLYQKQKHVNDMAIRDVAPERGAYTDTWLAKHSDFLPMENAHVYGTASRDFSFRNGAAIAPIFDETLSGWLASFLQRYPDPAQQVTWSEMGKEITSWDIAPFKGTYVLGKLHLCHQLAKRGLCKPATVAELGVWISNNRTKGAFRTLLAQDFWPLAADNDVVHTLQMVHNHLSKSLTAQQKTESNFGPAFVENYLCKISRARKLFDDIGLPTDKMVEDYFDIEREVDVRAWKGEELRATCEVWGG